MIGLTRLLLLLVLAGAAFTALVSLLMWLMNEERRLRRAVRQTLNAEPDAMLVAHGRGQAAALSMGAGIAVVWDVGAWRLLYPLEELVGVELIVDDHVAARAFRDEPRRPLERLPREAETIALRLVFDDPHHPDFLMELWPSPPDHRNAPKSAGAVMTEANRWLARAEAVMRRSAPQRSADPRLPSPAPQVAVPNPTADRRELRDIPPWEDDDLDIPDD